MTTVPAKPMPRPIPKAPPPINGNGTALKREVPQLTTGQPAPQPPRLIINAVEGWGKTTVAAYAPKPAILMARDESGYLTLLDAGRVPDVPRVRLDTWEETLALLDAIASSTPYQTLALDALNGFERLCHEYVCQRDFQGDWGEKGFISFQKGYEISLTEWLQLLKRLDAIRNQGVNIVILSHAKIITFKNPLGADYDKFAADCHQKTWAITAKWSDAVLFGNYFTVVETAKANKPESQKKGKGVGGTQRVLYTERRDAFDAKNRYGMPESIDIPNDPTESWNTIYAALRGESEK